MAEAQTDDRERAAALRERETMRRRIADLERERARIDADLSEARAQFRTGTFDADTPFEVLVDTLGALGEHVKGDIVRPGEGPYDFAWLERSGSVRRLSPDEARLMEQRPMESTTQPLTAAGEVDLTATFTATAPVDATGLPVPAEVAAADRETSQEQRAEEAGDAIEAREREGRARRGR